MTFSRICLLAAGGLFVAALAAVQLQNKADANMTVAAFPTVGASVEYERSGASVNVVFAQPGTYDVTLDESTSRSSDDVMSHMIVDVSEKELYWQHTKTIGWLLRDNRHLKVTIKRESGVIGEETHEFSPG